MIHQVAVFGRIDRLRKQVRIANLHGARLDISDALAAAASVHGDIRAAVGRLVLCCALCNQRLKRAGAVNGNRALGAVIGGRALAAAARAKITRANRTSSRSYW